MKKLKSEDDELDKLIEKQNKEYFKLRDALEAETTKPIRIEILRANKQTIPEGNSEVCHQSLLVETLQLLKSIKMKLLRRFWIM